MAAGNFNRLVERVIKAEGGFTNDRRDRGNWTSGKIGKGELRGTNFGISAMSYPNEDIKNLTKARAKFLYKRDFWDKLGGDDLPEGLDHAAFDYSVNSGVARPAKALQRIVRANRIDNILGRATINLICNEAAREGGAQRLIRALCAERLAFMKSLKTWGTYGNGWTRRVNEVERASIAMANGEKIRSKVVEAHARTDKALPQDKSMSPLKTKEGAATTAASIGAGGSASIETLEKVSGQFAEVQYALEPAAVYLDWLQYACVGLMVIGGALGLYIAIKKMRED